MPFDPISYILAKTPRLSRLVVDVDKDWGGHLIKNLGEPIDPNDMATKYYVDLTMSGINITYYMLNEQDPDVTTYKKTSTIPVDGTEQHIDVSGNSGDSVYVGGWITPADATPSVLPAGIIVMTMKAKRISGNLRIYGYFELYERKSDGSEVLIGTSAESGRIRAVDMYLATLPLFDNYYLESGSRIVIKAYVRFAGSGGTTTVRVFFEGNTASRLTLPTSKEILDTIYVTKSQATYVETDWFTPYDTTTYDFLGFMDKLSDGTIIHIYRLGTSHCSDNGKIVMRKSTTFGKTWSSPITIYDSSYDDRNIGGGVTENGTIVVAFARYDYNSGTMVDWGWIRSTDGGNTWSSYQTFPSADLSFFSVHGPLIEIPEQNKIGITLYESNPSGGAGKVKIAWSSDDGQTFTIQEVANNNYKTTEPACVYLGDGKLIMLFTDYENCRVMQTVSSDYGNTWSTPVQTNIPQPPYNWQAGIWLHRQNDKLIAIWRHGTNADVYPIAPFYISIAKIDEVFTDPTKWYGFRELGTSYAGYGSIVELNDGTLLLTASKYISTSECDLMYKYLPPLPYIKGRKCIRLPSNELVFDTGDEWI